MKKISRTLEIASVIGKRFKFNTNTKEMEESEFSFDIAAPESTEKAFLLQVSEILNLSKNETFLVTICTYRARKYEMDLNTFLTYATEVEQNNIRSEVE